MKTMKSMFPIGSGSWEAFDYNVKKDFTTNVCWSTVKNLQWVIWYPSP
jgi:hypothetical protein